MMKKKREKKKPTRYFMCNARENEVIFFVSLFVGEIRINCNNMLCM
jgi:hypothetical protein